MAVVDKDTYLYGETYNVSLESFRRKSYNTNIWSNSQIIQLAKAGFYSDSSNDPSNDPTNVKCFSCDYKLDTSEIINIKNNSYADVMSLHTEKCRFVKWLSKGIHPTKKFLSYDSLRYEKVRLETFVEWPKLWLSPYDLASDGFYYLRNLDHCACVYCRGIVGAWEAGDTPRGEHNRHFPHCSFVKGMAVGNVPLNHSTILDKLPLDGEECPHPPPRSEYHVLPPPGNNENYAGEYNRPPSSEHHVLGLLKHKAPMRKDYITREQRLQSFDRWPKRINQIPNELVEAGFFYCGLSDHVRCFHCGGGVRNWETDDVPWVLHARLYPNCLYVVLTMGPEFIDMVGTSGGVPSSGQFKPINENDLDELMKSDVTHSAAIMGFPPPNIRTALRQKLQKTGMPFFSIEQCMEAVLSIMEEETSRALNSGDSTSQGGVTAPGTAAAAAAAATATAAAATITTAAAASAGNVRIMQVEGIDVVEELGSRGSTARPDDDNTLPIAVGSYINILKKPKQLTTSNDVIEKVPPQSSSSSSSSSMETLEELKKFHESKICKICMDVESNVTFLPCRHMAFCSGCAVALTQCPICRGHIEWCLSSIIS